MFPKSENGKLNIYFHVSENSGVGYYRQYLPALKLKEKGLANVLINDFRWGEGNHVEPDIKKLFEIMRWADIVVVGRRDVPEFYAQWGAIREFFNIPVVLDTDDNVHNVRPQNPGYEGYHPGSQALMWNEYGISKVFDAVTVSTKNLKEYYKKYNPRIFVLPNSLDVQDWEKYPINRKNDGIIRFGFIGSAAHQEGVRMIKKPVIDILKKYPNTEFYITHVYHYLFQDQPKEILDRIIAYPWIKLEDWNKKMRELALDIGLAPLADNLFNRGKSNLRWMEYALSKTAPIVSPVEAYSCVKNGLTGLIVKEKDEWFEAIEKLIIDKDLREKIAEGAYKDVVDNYNIDLNAHLWNNTYTDIFKHYHDFFGKKKNFIVSGKKYRQIGVARKDSSGV